MTIPEVNRSGKAFYFLPKPLLCIELVHSTNKKIFLSDGRDSSHHHYGQGINKSTFNERGKKRSIYKKLLDFETIDVIS
jgi:hypothetical protein